MSLALLCPGQGTLGPEVLPWLDEAPGLLPHGWRHALAAATSPLPNARAQVLVTGLTLAAWQALASTLPAPAIVAGYSVGELSAAAVAGACSADTALALTTQRAAAMDRARGNRAQGLLAVHGPLPNGWMRDTPSSPPGMPEPPGGPEAPAPDRTAATGHPPHPSAGRETCADTEPSPTGPCNLHTAIVLAADRRVIGGLADALDALATRLDAAGIRSTRLAIDVASHTPWMAAARPAWRAALEAAVEAGTLQRPRRTLLAHADVAPVRSAAALTDALDRQLVTPIDWPACMDAIAERGVRAVLELGPGRALSALWRERHPHIPVRSADEFRSAQAVSAWVAQALQAD